MNQQLQQLLMQQQLGLGMLPSQHQHQHQHQHITTNSYLASLAWRHNAGGVLPPSSTSLSHLDLLGNRLFAQTTPGLAVSNAFRVGGESTAAAQQRLGPSVVTYLLQREESGLAPDPRIVELLVEQDRTQQRQQRQFR
jgi:hypothetical protein